MKQDYSLASPKQLVLRTRSVCSGLRTHISYLKNIYIYYSLQIGQVKRT